MHSKIKKLSIFIVLLLLLSSTCLSAEKNKKGDFNSFQIISVGTSNRYDLEAFGEVEIIKTHLNVITNIKKVLLKNKIDVSKIDVSMYVDELATDKNIQRKKWKSVDNSDTVSSPWIEVVQGINNYGKTETELKIDAGYVRLMMDLFSYKNESIIIKDFRAIPLIDSACFHKIERAYISNQMFDGYEIFELADAFKCAPKPIKRPLLSLFESSPQTDLFPMTEFVYQTLDSCLSTASEYYTELYPRLALKGLQILKSESNHEPMWWVEIVEKTQPMKRCPKTLN